MSNLINPRFMPIRSALRKLFPDGFPDWVVKLVNDLSESLSESDIAGIALAITALAVELEASLGDSLARMEAESEVLLDDSLARLRTLLTSSGSISFGSGATLKPKMKKLK